MSGPTVIGLAGFKRSGKSTAAGFLRDEFDAVSTSPSDPINDFAERWLGKDEANKDEPVEWLDGVNMRDILVTMGTEWGRNMVHPELWIRIVKREIETLAPAFTRPVFVLPSIRFDNEAELVRDYFGGKVVEISRPGHEAGDHASETPISSKHIDATIYNNSTLAHFEQSTVSVVSALFKDKLNES